MTPAYFVRVGTPRPNGPVDTYRELLDLRDAAEEREDDGMIVISVPRDEGIAWNEGRCPCGGVMRWAEAGSVPWERVCDLCGSGWDLHPVTLDVQAHADAEPAAVPPSQRPQRYTVIDRDAVDGHHAAVVARIKQSLDQAPPSAEELAHHAIYGSWAQRARRYPG